MVEWIIGNWLNRYSFIRYSYIRKLRFVQFVARLFLVSFFLQLTENRELATNSKFPVPNSRITLNEYTNNG